MSSGISAPGIHGMNPQTSFEQFESKRQAVENEKALMKKADESNFFVGPNGMTLSAKYKGWIGVSRRESMLSKARNPMLHNAVNQLYRKGSFIGDGGTAAVIKFEKATGIGLGKQGGTHMKKGTEMVAYLKKIIRTQSLSPSDAKLAKQLIRSLQKAILWR